MPTDSATQRRIVSDCTENGKCQNRAAHRPVKIGVKGSRDDAATIPVDGLPVPRISRRACHCRPKPIPGRHEAASRPPGRHRKLCDESGVSYGADTDRLITHCADQVPQRRKPHASVDAAIPANPETASGQPRVSTPARPGHERRRVAQHTWAYAARNGGEAGSAAHRTPRAAEDWSS